MLRILEMIFTGLRIFRWCEKCLPSKSFQKSPVQKFAVAKMCSADKFLTEHTKKPFYQKLKISRKTVENLPRSIVSAAATAAAFFDQKSMPA